MPRNPLKNFRRKSSGNALDLHEEVPPSQASSTFRVLERPDKTASEGFQRTGSNGRPLTSPPHNAKNKSADDLRLTINRGSAGTTHSGSSGYHDNSSASARFSSTSTLPSSFDTEADNEQNELYAPRKAPLVYQKTFPQPAPELPPPTFTARAGRALSFGLRSHRNSAALLSTPSISASQPPSPSNLTTEDNYFRDRSMTSSSYASTARPPQLESSIASSDFGGEFDNMFDGMTNSRNKDEVSSVRPVGSFARKDSDSMFPLRASSRQGMTPSPTLLEKPKPIAERRYSWDSRTSADQLMSGPSSEIGSPALENFPPSLKSVGGLSVPFSAAKGYQAVPERYLSPEPRDPRDSPTSNSGFLSAQSRHRLSDHSQSGRSDSPGPQAVWKAEVRKPTGDLPDRSLSASPNEFNGTSSQPKTPGDGSRYGRPVAPDFDSQNTTPRARRAELDTPNGALFDDSPAGPASRVINPGKQRMQDQDTPKRMTRAQYEQAQKQRLSRAMADNSRGAGSDESGGEEDEEEDEDEADRNRRLAAQRRKQEATMSVYRQQMKKVTGGEMNDLPSQSSRPNLDRASHSSPGLLSNMSSMHLGGASATDNGAGEDEDEDVPLGILAAHGFPTKARPPNTIPGYAGSVAGELGANVPAFARRLPADPYFGAGLVNPPTRETLAFGGGSGSVYGGGAPPPPAGGGLVGVIAGEERARAARRGSPNPVTGGYGPIPLPSNMHMPQLPRTNSMGSMMGANGFVGMGSLPGLPPMSPSEHAQMAQQQQMQQLMQMQQQMMQQMMVMQAGGMPMSMPGMQMPGMQMPGMLPQSNSMTSLGSNSFLQAPNGGRPMSIASNQGRAMTMMNPPPQWNDNRQQQRSNTMGNYAGSVYGMNLAPGGPQPGYTPSIAPSERSNIGMPSRYRPVSIMDGVAGNGAGNNSRSQTMSSMTMGQMAKPPSPLAMTSGNAAKAPKNTIRVVEKPKGAPKSNHLRVNAEDEDDEEGWAEMRRKREEIKKKRAIKKGSMNISSEPALVDMYHNYD